MIKNIIKILPILLFVSFLNIFSQNINVTKIEPPNWWTGMKHDTVQLIGTWICYPVLRFAYFSNFLSK